PRGGGPLRCPVLGPPAAQRPPPPAPPATATTTVGPLSSREDHDLQPAYWMRGGPCSIRRSIGSIRSRPSPQGIRSSHHVIPRSASGPTRSWPDAGPAGLLPPMTLSHGPSARPL